MTGSGLGGMTTIALVHLLWLLLFPLGLFCCLRGLEKRGFLIAGVVLIVLSLPALWFLHGFWPFDYLISPKPCVVATVNHAGWKVTLTQTPDVDFYHTDFFVISPTGTINWFLYDADDSKWWRAETAVTSNRIYFFRGSAKSDISPSYLDLNRKVFWSGYYRRADPLTEGTREKMAERSPSP
jgi:hypothetical protein